MQAACGLAQLEKLEKFICIRKSNFRYLRDLLDDLSDFIILPTQTPNSEPSWFGFPITLKENIKFSRTELLNFLESKKIGTRLLFGGNLLKQPYFEGRKYRVSGSLNNTNKIMNDTFWVGVYPGLTNEHLDYISSNLHNFFLKK